MIKSIFGGEKTTAYQLSKQIVLHVLENQINNPLHGLKEHDLEMTDAEKESLERHLKKQVNKVWEVIGEEWVRDREAR